MHARLMPPSERSFPPLAMALAILLEKAQGKFQKNAPDLQSGIGLLNRALKL